MNILSQREHLLLLKATANELNAHGGSIVDLGIICVLP
jgi:hypothetical protein